jgi:hypothetical protein
MYNMDRQYSIQIKQFFGLSLIEGNIQVRYFLTVGILIFSTKD